MTGTIFSQLGTNTTTIDETAVVYAGFVRRGGAMVVDIFFFYLIARVISGIFGDGQVGGYIIYSLYMPFLGLLYVVFFHAQFGATLGKMATGIQLRALDLCEVGWSHAVKRSAVDTVFTLAGFLTTKNIIDAIPAEQLQVGSLAAFTQLLQDHQSAAGIGIDVLALAWSLSELIVLFLNRKRRALHDYIAGTVVVVKQSLHISVATTKSEK